MGTMLQRAGMPSGYDQNDYLLEHPEVVEDIHRRYVQAGADIIYSPTFTMNRQRQRQRAGRVEEDIRRLMAPAKAVREEATAAGREILVALDMGPLGEMLEPMGALSFEEAYEAYAVLARAGAAEGANLIAIETMTDLYEVKAAVLAAKENSSLPVIVSMSFDEDGRTFTGTSLEVMAVTLEGLGVDAMGINCSLGPAQILPLIRKLMIFTDLPVFAKPNAGLPDPITGEYDITCGQFVEYMRQYIAVGTDMVGGCCGTDPDYIRGVAEAAREADRPAAAEAGGTSVAEEAGSAAPKLTSRSRVVTVDHVTVIGERLNPTGKKRMKQALLEGDFDYVLGQAIDQAEVGAEILDVNVGVPGLDEATVLPKLIKRLQAVTDLPLQIDSSNPAAIEAALRICNGKPVVNSVNGEKKSMEAVLPLVKKYGAAVIALTLDEKGIPESAEERFAIAERIVNRAEEYGIPRQDVIVDCLTLTVSAQQEAVNETLKAVRMVKEKLGLVTALGVSNVSFGLPLRPLINRTFLIMAMENGLDLPIINPNDEDMMASIYAFNVLKNADETAAAYIGRYGGMTMGTGIGGRPALEGAQPGMASVSAQAAPTAQHDLFRAVRTGMEGETVMAVKELLQTEDEMTVVNQYLIPALDQVGRAFEGGTLFLPQMLQAAAAAQAGFEVIRVRMAEWDRPEAKLGDVVIATVQGDVHDIGKNIVKVIMDNYGYRMIDLGRNVPVEEIVRAVKEKEIRLVGLSALMTTTLKSMEETIAALRAEAPACRVMVGGAVLTEDYARAIGADYYCSDAMKSVEAAQEVFGK